MIIHDFSTTMDGLYWQTLGLYNDYSLVTPQYNNATIQAFSAAIQQAIQ